MKKISLQSGDHLPKYLQVFNSIVDAIRRGELVKGEKIHSINKMSDELLLARDTVQKAYKILAKRGIIRSVRGNGYFIKTTDLFAPYKILLIFNKISNYKKLVYDAFVKTMGSKATIDLKIHHFDTNVLERIINDSAADYDFYVIMPHFYEREEEARKIIMKIQPKQLIILDKDITFQHAKYAAVFQDFKKDIMNALESSLDLLRKYSRLILVQPTIIPYPKEIAIGFQTFCRMEGLTHEIISEINANTVISKKEAYIVIEETDLVNLVKFCKTKKLQVGKDVGILSCNETPLKEILLNGISVISTDHAMMGETAARMILEGKQEKIKNPFRLIRRQSL